MLRSIRPAQIAALAAAICASTAQAAPGGELGTLPLGRYVCELSGDATGPASIPVESEHFTVIAASSYRTQSGRGSYLMTDDDVVMTSGPFDGKRYRQISERSLRAIHADGSEGELRCILTGGRKL